MRILGLVGVTHDSGIAILNDGLPELVLEEERLNRQKKTRAFPRRALRAAFGDDGAGLGGIDAIVTPWDVKRLRRTVTGALFARFPFSLTLLSQHAHTPQRGEIVFLDLYMKRKLRRMFPDVAIPPIVCVGHHDSHAAAFFVSPFEEANVLVMDGYGDDAATSVYTGAGNRLERRWHSSFFNSVGLVYTFVTEYLGFTGLQDEGKVMALAAFGDDSYVHRFADCIRLEPEGRYAVNMDYFSYEAYGELRPFKRKFYDVFGPPRRAGEALTDRHRAIAYALQKLTEDVILHVVREMCRTTSSRNLVLTGGVALNCVANARILEMTGVREIWVPPGASDTGAPFGATLWHHHQTLGNARRFELDHAYYGLGFDDDEIAKELARFGIVSEQLGEDRMRERVARDLADGKIVGWFQGRFEMGPRALGNRSILADPRHAKMRDVINDKIKHRENFRPFAPAVLLERAAEFFHIDQPDPFMTIAPCVRPEKAELIGAAVHADGTGRIQTVTETANPRYYRLIKAFGDLTGVPVLLNTSFNRHEPIVATPREAISCYLRTGMDVLAIGSHYVVDRCPAAVTAANTEFASQP